MKNIKFIIFNIAAIILLIIALVDGPQVMHLKKYYYESDYQYQNGYDESNMFVYIGSIHTYDYNSDNVLDSSSHDRTEFWFPFLFFALIIINGISIFINKKYKIKLNLIGSLAIVLYIIFIIILSVYYESDGYRFGLIDLIQEAFIYICLACILDLIAYFITKNSAVNEQKNTIVANAVNSDNNSSTQNTMLNHDDKMQHLKDLKSLLDSGVLSQEEFDNEKKKILNS